MLSVIFEYYAQSLSGKEYAAFDGAEWEAEFFALQDSNNKLAGALREANAAAAQWRQQLEAQRAEAERLRQRVREPHPPKDPKWPKGHCEGPASYLSWVQLAECVISAGHFPES